MVRVTKRQIRRIIKEEKQKLLSENAMVHQSLLEDMFNAMDAIYQNVANNPDMLDQDPEDVAAEVIQSEVAGFMDYIGLRGQRSDY